MPLRTITRSEVSEWDTDRLGRPLRNCPRPRGRRAAVSSGSRRRWWTQTWTGAWRISTTATTARLSGIRDSDRIAVGGRTLFVPVALPDSPVSPFTGAAYRLVSVRLVEDAT